MVLTFKCNCYRFTNLVSVMVVTLYLQILSSIFTIRIATIASIKYTTRLNIQCTKQSYMKACVL